MPGARSGRSEAKAPKGRLAAPRVAATRSGTNPLEAAFARHSAASRVFPTPAGPAKTIALGPPGGMR